MIKYVDTDDVNIKLHYQIDNADNPIANVVINHGFAEHLGRYEHVKNRLVGAGFSVLRYDLRGHGQSIGPKGHINTYKDFLNDADIFVDMIKEENPNLPTYMLGHSMGGLITTLYGIKHPQKLDGQILSGAANGKLPEMTPLKTKFLSTASNFLPKLRIKNPISNELCSDIEVVKAYLSDPLVLKFGTTNFYNEFTAKATDDVLANLHKYNLPVLIFHGELDEIVLPSVSQNVYESISSKDKEIEILPSLYHEIFNEKNKHEILDKVILWLNNRT